MKSQVRCNANTGDCCGLPESGADLGVVSPAHSNTEQLCRPRSAAVAVGAIALGGLFAGCRGNVRQEALREFESTKKVSIAGVRVEDQRPRALIVSEEPSLLGVIIGAAIAAGTIGATIALWRDRDRWKSIPFTIVGLCIATLAIVGSYSGQQTVFDLKAREIHFASRSWFGTTHAPVLFGQVKELRAGLEFAEEKDGNDTCVLLSVVGSEQVALARTRKSVNCGTREEEAFAELLKIVEGEMKLDVKRP